MLIASYAMNGGCIAWWIDITSVYDVEAACMKYLVLQLLKSGIIVSISTCVELNIILGGSKGRSIHFDK